jgi:phosphotriesterase-related protein
MTNRREFLLQSTAACLSTAISIRTTYAAGAARKPGIVQTVQGPLDAAKLGFTLPHEHVYVGSPGLLQTWPELVGGRAKFIASVVDKLKAVKDAGVDTIVDVTPADVGRDVRLLEEVSRKSGVHIVACTGHWLYPSLSMDSRSVEELTEFFTLEIERGLEGTDIRPGVIKVATDKPGITPFLEKSLRAAARASKATGVPITTHTYAVGRGGEQQAAIFESEGLDPGNVCLGHSDATKDLDYLSGLARRGYVLGMDQLSRGASGSQPQLLSWHERAQSVAKLVAAGFASQLFLSNDWFFGAPLGPKGYMESMDALNPDGMLFNVRKTIPYLKELGVDDAQIRTIAVGNPRRFFGGG